MAPMQHMSCSPGQGAEYRWMVEQLVRDCREQVHMENLD